MSLSLQLSFFVPLSLVHSVSLASAVVLPRSFVSFHLVWFPLSFLLSVSNVISVFFFSCRSFSLFFSLFSPFSLFGFRCRSSPLFRQFCPCLFSAVFLSLSFVH